MKNILIVEYTICLFSFVDARFENPLLKEHAVIWAGYAFLSIIQILYVYIVEYAQNRKVIPDLSVTKYLWLILAVMGVQLFNNYTDVKEWIVMVVFLVAVFSTGCEFAYYHGLKELLWINFLIPNIATLLNYMINRINIIENIAQMNLAAFFSSDYSLRTRFNLGFPNPNTTGSLAAGLVMIALPLLTFLKTTENSATKKILVYTMMLFDFLILVESGSRTAVIAVAAGYLLYLFFVFVNNPRWVSPKMRQTLLYLMGFFSCAGLVLIANKFMTVYLDSGRNQAYQLLTYLKGIRVFIGLGILNPGAVDKLVIDGQPLSGHLDNYYVYLLMTIGIAGVILFLAFFGKLIQEIRKRADASMTGAVLSCFAFDLLYGFGETSVLYHQFPASLIMFAMFLCVAMGENPNRT